VYKALQGLPGAREVRWRHIEVIRRHDGRPSIAYMMKPHDLAKAAGDGPHFAFPLPYQAHGRSAWALIEGLVSSRL
jgi:hypothetical protein